MRPPTDHPAIGPRPESPPAWDRLGSVAFRLVLLGFLAASFLLARGNNTPGSPDSCSNLTLARNLIQGRGYVSSGVGDLWVAKEIPFFETTRPPGLPDLLAAFFSVTGPSLAVPVLVNALAVAANALLLRWAVARSGRRSMGDVAGLLILLSYDYEMVSIWNNNLLAGCHSLLILLGIGRSDGSRRSPWLPLGLACVLAFGFLLKPTFILGTVPFATLVLGSDGSKTWPRRLVDLAVCLALFLALTSIYWGRNLLVYGDPLYSPSFTSSRLAMRYGILGEDAWRQVRFGRPMTRGEVVQSLGTVGMLVVDAKMLAKTVLYSILMNPGVAACASALIVFGRRVRWREYLGVALLSGGVIFEVGVYNHHEFRYTWPIYPCLIFLALRAVDDFADSGAAEMSPSLASRFRLLFALVLAGSLLIGLLGATMAWQDAFRTSRRPTPGWRVAVAQLPPSAVILTSDVASLAWWSDRPCVTAPVGPRADLTRVVDHYRVDHYLALGPTPLPDRGLPLTLDDLTLLDRGEGWTLYRIKGFPAP